MCGSELLTRRALHQVVDMPHHAFDARTHARMFHPEHLGLIDPFIGVDLFHMPQNFFLPHPHGGMSAVTLLLDDSPGGVVNRDSLGDHSTIQPGDLHWTQAGSGIVHEETPSQPGRAAIGLQIFVNMARRHKQDPAAVFKVNRADMPVWQGEGVQVKVAAGSFAGLSSPIGQDPRWATRVDLLAITLAPNARIDLPVDNAANGFLIVTAGEMMANDEPARADQTVVLAPAPADAAGRSALTLQTGASGAHAVLLAGVPLREPVVPYGPFVGNSRQDIAAYAQAFQRGDMGLLEPSFTR
ncbi:pirin family protein [Hydrogenophaga sp. R2]|uniref:pirin family protein n=1 Tax=Hydrogenophaga sp. R2 TaxID=3132827 RepID=UPI003CEAEB5C